MDKQLACATFATLIPVLVIAAFLSGEVDKVLRYGPWRIFGGAAVALGLFGELCAVIGTATVPHYWQLVVAMLAAELLVGILFGLAAARVFSSKQSGARNEKDR